MRRILCSLLFFMLTFLTCVAKDRLVVMTLDDSGSMRGAKYEGANYGIQLIASVLDDQDAFYLIKNGVAHEIDLANKQASIDNIAARVPQQVKSEYHNIEPALQILESKKLKENFLIICGDGHWRGVQRAVPRFQQVYTEIKPQTIFLRMDRPEALSDRSLLESSILDHYPQIEKLMTNSGDNSAVRKSMETVAKRVVGVSAIDVKAKQEDSNVIIFKPAVPLYKCFFIYQDNKAPNNFPNIKKVSAGGEKVKKDKSFLASNFGIHAGKNLDSKLSGRARLIQLEDNKVLREATEIRMEFDKDIDASKVLIVPFVAISLHAGPEGTFKSSDTIRNIYVVCDTTENLGIVASLTKYDNTGLPESVLKEAKVEALMGAGKKLPLTYGAGAYRSKIVLEQDTTVFSIGANYSGYFDRRSQIFTIVRDSCPEQIIDHTKLRIDFEQRGVLDFEEKPCRLRSVLDLRLNPQDVNNYKLTLHDAPHWMNFHITKVGNEFQICPRLPAIYCNCFVSPGEYSGRAEFESLLPGKPSFNTTWHLTVEDKDSLWAKCKTCVLLLLGFLLTLFYIIALIRKPRFHRNARIKRITKEKSGAFGEWEVIGGENTAKLRKSGLVAGITRWLVPFRSERNKAFRLEYIAGNNKSYILLAKKSQGGELKIDERKKLQDAGKYDYELSKDEFIMVEEKGKKKIYYYYTT